jgi:hypothetical protein
MILSPSVGGDFFILLAESSSFSLAIINFEDDKSSSSRGYYGQSKKGV